MRTIALFVAILLALAPLPSVAQDAFLEGLFAHEKGDYAEAARWYRAAADGGDADAQMLLGEFYRDGLGVGQDYAEAARWFRLAAEHGDAGAQDNLGWMYHYGEGVAQDSVEAARWYRLAAKQGIDGAQYNLGLKYAKGEGVPQDYVLAHMWANIAAANGNDSASEIRQNLVVLMTTADISEAQRRARVCMASNYQDCD